MAAIVGPNRHFALAYAIPPDHPGRFKISYNRTDFSIRLKFGLSPAASGALHSRAPFSVVVDLVDARWGLRDALRRYYKRNPNWFSTSVDRYGLWRTGDPSDYSSFNPDLYVFHEAGGVHSDAASTVQEYAVDDDWAFDQRYSVYTFPYTNAGNLEMTDLKKLPGNYAEAIATLKAWKHGPQPFATLHNPNTYLDIARQKQRIRNSGLFNTKGNYSTKIRYTSWGKNTVQFAVNPNPALFNDSDRTTIGKYLLNEYGPKLLKSSLVDGFYVDSLGLWGRYYNYRRDHFRYARVPLTYDDSVRRPALFNANSEFEFLWALRRRLHQQGKLVMANSDGIVRGGPLFLNFPLDVVGFEDGSEFQKPTVAAQYRALSAQKPVISLYKVSWDKVDQAQLDDLVKTTVLEGVTLASGPSNRQPFDQISEQELAYQRRYVPVIQRLAKAGWEPVTGVHTNDSAVLGERYGNRDDLYLVLYNTSDEQKKLTLSVDHDVVQWSVSGQIQDALAGQNLPPDQSRALLKKGRINLKAGELMVLHFGDRPRSRGSSNG